MTRDPEVRYSQGEKPTAVARFSLAVPRRFKRDGEPDCDFINCVAFGKTAETLEKYGVKGLRIGVVGEWRTGSYTNRDGNKIYTNDCSVESFEFCDSKSDSGQTQQTAPRPTQAQQPAFVTDANGFMNIPDGIDEELPFN